MEGVKNCQLDDYWKGEIKEIRVLKSKVSQRHESGAATDLLTLLLDTSYKGGLVLHGPRSAKQRLTRRGYKVKFTVVMVKTVFISTIFRLVTCFGKQELCASDHTDIIRGDTVECKMFIS
jgi:hypothetical protein